MRFDGCCWISVLKMCYVIKIYFIFNFLYLNKILLFLNKSFKRQTSKIIYKIKQNQSFKKIRNQKIFGKY
ncbi:hypothetical protein BpHYR1_036728 [Brachionus plicatilis]|uniref:Transmembrane protein n=1 Tax=Brachionus plicatilis TaxID=10195 RepID=A0A3M7RLE7_BRAPC|nr:hypothetical protein BpHYR1_036728 [Brachionus plicatilis]